MFLLIDVQQPRAVTVTLHSCEDVIETHTYAQRHRALLESVDDMLQRHHVQPKDIEGIAIVQGAGGFTGSRLSAVLANTWHEVMKTPIIAVSPKDIETEEKIIALANKYKEGTGAISPSYSAPPSIGKKSK